MAVYGNAGSLSSLLSAASAARKRQESLQDSIAAYEWDLSPRTEEDYKKYAAHLSERMKSYQSSDPMRALEFQKSLTAVQRAYTSAKVGRETTQVLYGNKSNRDKYNTIAKLYEEALASGDQNLAQRLESQAARLSVTIQNEEAARAAAAEASSNRAKAASQKMINDSVKEIDRKQKQVESDFRSGLISLDEYSTNLGDPNKGVFAQKQAILSSAIENPNTDPTDANGYVDKLNTMYDNADFKKFTGPALKQFAENRPYAVRVDPLTGERTIQKRNIVGAGPTKPGDLNNIFAGSGVDLAKVKKGDSQFIDVARNLTGKVGDPQENYQFQVFNSKAEGSPYKDSLGGKEFSYYLDPITGEPIVYDPEANVPRTPLKRLEESIKEEKKASEGTSLNLDNLVSDYKSLGSTIIGGAKGALNLITGNFGKQQEADRIAKLKAEADARAAVERLRQADLARSQALKAIPAANPSKPVTFNSFSNSFSNVKAPFKAPTPPPSTVEQRVADVASYNPFGGANVYGNLRLK